MWVGLEVNIINIILNFLLIYPTRTVSLFGMTATMPGAGWGIEGAAVASAIAYTYGGVAITYMLWRHQDISPRGQRLRPDPAVLKPCLRVAFPNMLQRFATSLGYVAFASMINALGETATAAHTIANTVESAFYIPGWGMQTAAATLAGNAWGAGDEKRLKRLARTILPLEVGLMILSGGSALPLRSAAYASVLKGRTGDRSGNHCAENGGSIRAVLRRTHCDRGNHAGNRKHGCAVCL